MSSRQNYSSYINKIIKQVHPDSGISGDAVSAMNNLILITIDKIAKVTNTVMMRSNKKTVSSREIQTAVRLLFPKDLAKHAHQDGTKAVIKYNSSKSDGSKGQRSARAGLIFPVTRTENIFMSKSIAKRKSEDMTMYLTAVVEYLCAELLELAGTVALNNKKKRVTPRYIIIAIYNDDDLSALYKDSYLAGGVVPNIHSFLLKKK